MHGSTIRVYPQWGFGGTAIKQRSQNGATFRELDFLRKVQESPVLPRIFAPGYIEFGGTAHIVMQAYRELSQENFNYDAAREDLLRAVRELHSQGICHNNVTPDNVMFNPGTLRFILIGLGNAALKGHSVLYANTKFVLPHLRGQQAPAVYGADEYGVDQVLDYWKQSFSSPDGSA